MRMIRPVTADMYAAKIKAFNDFLGGDKLLKDYTEDDALTYRHYVLLKNQPSTFNIARRQIKTIFNGAIKDGMIDVSIWLRVGEAPQPDKPIRRASNDDIRDALLFLDSPAAQNISALRPLWFWATMVRCFRLTGMRMNQLRHLRWRDINFSQRSISLESEGSKNRKRNVIPLPTKLHSHLLDLHY